MCDRCYQAHRKWAHVPLGPQPVKFLKRRGPRREHGTVKGCGQHYSRGEKPCEECRVARLAADRLARGATQPSQCAECAGNISLKDHADPTWSSRFCSDDCKTAHARRTWRESPAGKRAKRKYKAWRRAVERGTTRPAERFDPIEVFERDQWSCQCCHRKVDRTKIHPHKRAPVLDHIIPLSKGGEHSKANTQLLCSACNAAKSDGAANDQLRLIG